jgi:hypothetical protein
MDDATVEAMQHALASTPPRCYVVGAVRYLDGSPGVGLTVRAFDRDLRREQVLGAATTDGEGYYQITYTPAQFARAEKGAADLVVRVFRGKTTLFDPPIEAMLFNAPALAVVNVDLTTSDPRALSEYELILAAVTPLLDGVALDGLQEDAKTRDITFLAGETGIDADELTHFAVAQKLATGRKIPAELFYALLAENTLLQANPSGAVGFRFNVDLGTDLVALFYDVVLLPAGTVTAAVAKAIADLLVPASLQAKLGGIEKQLAGALREAQAYVQEQRPKLWFQQVQSFLAADKHEEVLAILQQETFGDLPRLLQRLQEAAAFPDAKGAKAAGAAAALGEVLGHGSRLVDAVRKSHRIGHADDVHKLARLSHTDWAQTLRKVAPALNEAGRPLSRSLIDLHASTLARQMERLYPTTAFAAELERDKSVPPQHRARMAELLEKHPKFDLATGNVDVLLRPKRPTAKGSAGATPDPGKTALKAMQRVFKIAPRYRQTKALLDGGVRSAAAAHAMGVTRFVETFASGGEFTPEEARAAFRKASDIHTASALLAGQLQSAAAATHVAALASPLPPAQLDAVTKDFPNLKSLFQLTDYCACIECRTVYSAAAYLVDTLEFLKNRLVVDSTQPLPPVSVKLAKDVLFERRPDLGDTDLSCDNTNTPVAYIDVVCELLEDAVAPDPGIPFTGAIASGVIPAALLTALQASGFPFTAKAAVFDADLSGNRVVRDKKVVCKLSPAGGPTTWRVRQLRQTYGKAAEVAAAPQYVNLAAYSTLGTSDLAFGLPFDLSHQEARGYFAQFGVGRAELMRALQTTGGPQDHEIAAEALGLSDQQRALIVAAHPTAVDQKRYWSSGALAATDFVKVVDNFLNRTGLAYADLQDLLTRQWLNPGGAIFVRYLDTSCDLSELELENLDNAALDRFHRFIRLWKKVPWTTDALDRAIRAARLGNGVLDDGCLVQLQQLARLQSRLGLSPDESCNLFDVIPADGDDSRYAQLFLNASANGSVNQDFQPDNVRQNELDEQAVPGSGKKLAPYSSYLALCLGITLADCIRLVDSLGAGAILSALNVARVYALSLLGKAVNLAASDLLTLQSLTGIDALASPGATLAFLDQLAKVRAAGVRPADLQYLLDHQATDLASRELTDALATGVLTALQRSYQTAFAQNPSPFNPSATADENKSAAKDLLAKLPNFTPGDLSLFVTIFDDAWQAPAATPTLTPAQFIDQKLASYVDTAPIKAAQVALAGAVPPKETERNALIESVDEALARYLFAAAKTAALSAAVVQTFGVTADVAAVVLSLGRLKQPAAGGNRTLLDLLTDDGLIDTINTPPAPPTITPTPPFDLQFRALRLLHQMGLLLGTLKLPADAVGWMLVNNPALGWMELDNLKYQDDVTAVSFAAWAQLQDALHLVTTYPAVANSTDPAHPFTVYGLFDLALAPATSVADLLGYLAQLTGWDPQILAALDGLFGFSAVNLAPYRVPASYLRFEAAVPLLRQLGLDVPSGLAASKPQLTAADAALMRQALKARYTEADWLGVLKSVQDPLRQQKRDALVAYLLSVNPEMTSSDDLYDYFLIDVEMCSCMPTSRIVQAHATIQLFVQRCLMGLEPRSVANVKQDAAWEQWKWMANYQVWVANRKVFLYPENWIDPQLRHDKSELFTSLENTLQQSALTNQSVEDATTAYLAQLDDIAQLDVMACHYQTDSATMHVFARTKGGDPAIYYYRQFRQERSWTPWAKLDLDITGDDLLAFDRNGRLTLAWPVFTNEPSDAQSSRVPPQSQMLAGTTVPVSAPSKRWNVRLAVSEQSGTKWLPKKVSKDALHTGYFSALPPTDAFAFFAWTLGSAGQAISCTCYGAYLGSFALTGCRGYPEPTQGGGVNLQFLPQFKDAPLESERFTELSARPTDDLAIRTILNLSSFQTIVNDTPGTFKVTYPMQMSVIDWILLWLESYLAIHQNPLGVRSDKSRYVPLGTFMPYFYGDASRTFAIVPGFYRAATKGAAGGVEKTFSDIQQFVQDAIALLAKYLQIYQADPAHDLNKVVQQLVADTEFVRLKAELAAYRSLEYGVAWKTFYHPLLCSLRATLYRDGIPGLMSRDVQLTDTGFDFASVYHPTSMVVPPYPRENVDFSEDGAYSSYNWELFFHLPFEIAMRLHQDQQFEEARDWFHYIFNPVGAADAPAPQKFWVTKPFFQTTVAGYLTQRIDTIVNAIAVDPTGATITDLKAAVADWRANPFDPHVVARSRPVAYQVAVVLQYIQNLIDWGDNLFRQFTRESVTQATQMYILADKLLGSKPRIVPPAVSPPIETFNQLEAKVDLFGDALLDLENMIPDLGLLPHGGAELPPSPITSLYFCIPPNDNMLQVWDTVADRLFKIRNCQNIDGVESILALFSPPIDPGALVRATAGGLDVSSFIAGLGAPLPNYRFSVMSQKATELVQQVSALGGSLLQALEKRDAEALSRLHAQQEIAVLNSVRAVKLASIAEAQGTLDGLQKSRLVTEERRAYYANQSYMNAWEIAAVALSGVALVTETAGEVAHLGAGIVQATPQYQAGGAGFGGSPLFTVSEGGQNLGAAAVTAADVLSIIAHVSDRSAAMAVTQGGYQRRQDEWSFQVRLADKELAQIDQQIATAKVHLDMLNKDLASHDLQSSNATETDLFLRSKYTNQELYEWMIGQVSAVYFQAYQLAFDVAKKAERCFGYELGSDATFLQYGYWDSLKNGLMTAEALRHDLKRMEAAYLDQNRREYEITKHVSLSQLDPLALIQLKNTGTCIIQVPEALFDLDHPGHYMRRMKSVSLSITGIGGPYVSVGGELSLISNRYRRNTTLRQGAGTDKEKYEEQAGNDDRFAYNLGSIQSIATSSAQTDSGTFELNFRDERYLPFEGTGAISTWQLRLPSALRQFDYGTISDVILHLRFTARDGGTEFRTCVEGGLREIVNEMTLAANRSGLYQSYVLGQQFPNEWYQLKQTQATQLTLGARYLPFLTQGHAPTVDHVTWIARVNGDPATYVMSVNATPFTLNRNPGLANLCVGDSAAVVPGTSFSLSAGDTSQLEELIMLVHYTLSA